MLVSLLVPLAALLTSQAGAPSTARMMFVQHRAGTTTMSETSKVVVTRAKDGSFVQPDGPSKLGDADQLECRDLLPDESTVGVLHWRVKPGAPMPSEAAVIAHLKFDFALVLRGGLEIAVACEKAALSLGPGDFVVVPPTMGHRVISHTDDLELLQITKPGAYRSEWDGSLTLPSTLTCKPFVGSQRFVHHQQSRDRWAVGGAIVQPADGGYAHVDDKGITWCISDVGEATAGEARVRVGAFPKAAAPSETELKAHGEDARFLFVTRGSMKLAHGEQTETIGVHDFVSLPADAPYALCDLSPDADLVELTMTPEIVASNAPSAGSGISREMAMKLMGK